jgi:tryptophanyl-tRNA synthetase
MRPTGRLHIGHYFGALQNWVRLQNDPEFECFYFIADWHALTSDYADTSQVAQNTIEIVTDYLAAGLDPQQSVIFQQSQIHEHAELHLLLSMVTPLSWLERVPTYKEAFENVTNKDLHTYGFLGYPCLQTADIVIYSKIGTPLFVPVGEDQVSHVELSREIVRRFNLAYQNVRFGKFTDSISWFGVATKIGMPHDLNQILLRDKNLSEEKARDLVAEHYSSAPLDTKADYLSAGLKEFVTLNAVLEEPQVLLTKTPRIPGLDGRKMSKSYGNAITLSESDDDIRKKTKVMVTDPARKRRTDPGNPDICPVYDWHKLFSPQETLDWAAQGCRTAGIGCIECKSKMADHLIQWIAPVRERRLKYEAPTGQREVLEIIDAGSKVARSEAQSTMSRVREAVFGWDKKRNEIASDSSS